MMDVVNPMQAASLVAAAMEQDPLNCDEVQELQNSVKQTLQRNTEDVGKGKKTDVCRHWARGFCNRGITCGFAHTGPTQSERMGSRVDENGEPYVVVKSSVPCKDFSAGKCNRGERCKFAHIGTGPKKVTPSCRDWMAGTCNRGDLCKYKHDNPSVPVAQPVAQPITAHTTPSSIPATPPIFEMQQQRMVPHMLLAPSFQVATAAHIPIFMSTPPATPDTPVWIVDSPQSMPFNFTSLQPMHKAIDGSDAQALAVAEHNASRLRAQAAAAEMQLATLKSGNKLIQLVGTDSPISIDSHPTTFSYVRKCFEGGGLN
eukprot:TRINITY_DN6856_c0_g1_i2.p1 TRINITY_DN6856_c0_g1~~TRINITY_DN6856_c0_g1_i2.p1  ORF type:complete len:334 (+),score=71.52 TRINITY_DN6856_c0_g1_i2:59-1003(+)